MIRKYISSSVLCLVFLDQLVLIASLAAALWLKTFVVLPDQELSARLHINLFLHLWPFLAMTLVLGGAYNLDMAVGGLRPLLRRTALSTVALAGVWVAGTFYLKMNELFVYSRGVFTLFLAFSGIGFVAVRLAFAEVGRLWRAKTGNYRRILVFGGETLGPELISNLKNQVFVPVSTVVVTDEVELPGVIRLSEEAALARIRQGEVDHIIIDLPPRRIRLLLQVAQLAEQEGVPIQITPTIFPGLHLRPRVDRISKIPVIELAGQDLPLVGLLAKRALDVTASAIGLMVLSPLLLVISVLIKLTSRGPVFYLQQRVGLNGRRFRMVKFRTMRVDAEQATGPIWAVDNDPRATYVGRILRQTNLDELPQLINVLWGNMSLVGPRPERPVFVEEFKPVIERYSHKHWVKPGMTGWAQVNGWRGRTDLTRRIEHDIYYIENWSFWLDIKILLLTVVRVIRKAEGNLQEVAHPVGSFDTRHPSPSRPPAYID
jgi:exopolysaccharide biosynthesis polyprenyl glycosylphosphotransferase